jgi:5-methylcytosine-specific restriction protein A
MPRSRRRDRAPADEWSYIRHVLTCRSGGRCEVCGNVVGSWPPWEAHHRLPRGMGGTTDPEENAISRLIVAHARCHLWCESNRQAAESRGLIVFHGLHPLDVPLVLAGGRRVYLDDNGLYLNPPPGEPAWVTGPVPVPSAA